MDEFDRAHALLGTRPDATRDQIRRAFRDAAKRRHPDAGGAAADFIDLRAATALLLARAGRSTEPNPTSTATTRVAAHYASFATATSVDDAATTRDVASSHAGRTRQTSASSFATVLARHLATI